MNYLILLQKFSYKICSLSIISNILKWFFWLMSYLKSCYLASKYLSNFQVCFCFKFKVNGSVGEHIFYDFNPFLFLKRVLWPAVSVGVPSTQVWKDHSWCHSVASSTRANWSLDFKLFTLSMMLFSLSNTKRDLKKNLKWLQVLLYLL